MSDGKSIYFMPLGGGQEVGASCYFLKIGGVSFLLDCGTGRKFHTTCNPAFLGLEKSFLIHSKTEIGHVFVSHAHMDHIGFLPTLMKELPDAVFYMTETTKELARFQLYDRMEERLAARYIFDRIRTVSFMQNFPIGDIKVTIYPAGHIPGAMMVLFSWKGKDVLYTGDYSTGSTPLTEGCVVPEDIRVDCMITCALHAKNDSYKKSSYGLDGLLRKTGKLLEKGESVQCIVSQLSKGIEFLKILDDAVSDGKFPRFPVYLDESVYTVVKHMENTSVALVKDNVFPFMPKDINNPHIIITACKNPLSDKYRQMPVDFTLHDGFAETAAFIKQVNPRTAVLVHCASQSERDSGMTVEQFLMRDAECRTQFIFADNEQIYRIC